jgi:hypothetical protein
VGFGLCPKFGSFDPIFPPSALGDLESRHEGQRSFLFLFSIHPSSSNYCCLKILTPVLLVRRKQTGIEEISKKLTRNFLYCMNSQYPRDNVSVVAICQVLH